MDSLAKLQQECNKSISKMQEAIRLLEKIREFNGESAQAIRELSGKCRFISHEGEVLTVSIDPIWKELEYLREEEASAEYERQADELFGEAHG